MAVARKTDPATSHEAAASVTNITETQQAILTLLTWPKTDEDLVDVYYQMADSNGWRHASPSGIRSRRAELTARGLIEDTGGRVKLRSGRFAILWRTAQGA